MSTQNNAWSRWHPRNPIKGTPREIDNFYNLYDGVIFKTYQSASKPGDIIEDVRRNVQVTYETYQCPHCRQIFRNESETMRHLLETQDNHPKMKSTEEFIVNEASEQIGKALIYYELVKPRRINIMPNGDIVEKGGKDWWYWCPQKLANGRWSPLEMGEPVPENIRVLYLLAIIPEEETEDTDQELDALLKAQANKVMKKND